MILTDLNCPSLRFIKWDRHLLLHPEMRKGLELVKTGKQKDLPFLQAPLKDISLFGESELEKFNVVRDTLAGMWSNISSNCRNDIWTTSKSYVKAFEDVSDSIAEHRAELLHPFLGKHLSGLLIETDEDVSVSIFYDFCLNGVESKETSSGEIGIKMNFDGVVFVVMDRRLVAFLMSKDDKVWMFAEPSLADHLILNNGSVDAGLMFCIMDQLIFREWADVVSKTSEKTTGKPTSVLPDIGNDEEVAEVKSHNLQARMFSASWFTRISRVEGFSRRGYWGIRWKGRKGSLKPVLVPVKSTQVKGYVRKAGKEGKTPELFSVLSRR